MSTLIECVPNFSEARRPEVVAQILEAIKGVAGARLLDYSSDLDHNRTVVTFVGDEQAVEYAAFAAIAKAAELIDMREHEGAHPRLGATDVVPFVPVRGAKMEQCVAIAKRLAERVGTELNIPVYLYENAATRPDRINLADVRRGQYEALVKNIGSDPNRAPDFAPSDVGTAGGTIIGARPFLVAYNIYLTTEDVSIAQNIAKAIRHSNGGYRYVKGMGLEVEGMAHVSMNLTDYTKTPLYRVQETVRREAERYGVGIRFAELVGMIPQKALIDTARWYLQLDRMTDEQIIENRLADDS